MDELLTKISEWIAGFDADFERIKAGLSRDIKRVEASILRRVIADILPAISTEGDRIRITVGNIAKANIINRVFDSAYNDEVKPIIEKFAGDMLEISGKNADYYFSIGMDRRKVEAIKKDLSLIRAIIGLNSDGELAKDGFLFNLGRSEAVRNEIKQYIIASIGAGQDLTAFKSGLKNLVSGGRQVDGVLLKYWDRFAFDAYAQVREVNNLHFAQELGLKWFVYQGGIIESSRDFCRKKNGKVFSDKEALRDWPNDPDLIDKRTKSQYKPLIDRGRYNCRHFLMYISEDRAMELKDIQNGKQ